MTALHAVALTQTVVQKFKPNHRKNKEADKNNSMDHHDQSSQAIIEKPKPPIETLLEYDMSFVADAMGLTYQAREALKSYDARTLEDFCLMSEMEFESMIVAEFRLGNRLPPLQQRKIQVLLKWAHQISEDAAIERAASKFTTGNPNDSQTTSSGNFNGRKRKPTFLDRLADPFGTLNSFQEKTTNTMTNTIKTVASYASGGGGSGSGSVYSSPSGSKGNLKEEYKYVIIPEDWQKRFRHDLPKLKQKLFRESKHDTRWSLIGDTFLALRWILCGYGS